MKIMEALQWAGLGLLAFFKPIAQDVGAKAATDALNNVLAAKGLDDEWLDVEALGAYFPNPKPQEVGFLMDAMRHLVKNQPIFASNLRRVIGSSYWASLGGGRKERKKEKESDDKVVVGFLGKIKNAKGDARNCVAFFCSGTNSREEVLDRIETAGLFNEFPDGGLKKPLVLSGRALAKAAHWAAATTRQRTPQVIEATGQAITGLALTAKIVFGIIFMAMIVMAVAMFLIFP